DFNLIVIHEPGVENYGRVRNYVKSLLGNRIAYAYSYQSVILYKCFEDPHLCAEVLRKELRGSGVPIIKVIPVDAVVRADIESVRSVVRELAGRIPLGETFRVTLQGHLEKVEEGFSIELSTDRAVREVASEVNRPVDLTNPSWIVYVRVVKIGLAKVAAISLLKPHELERVP
ncbi:MAG: THUMP domain-containing protein, partial [Sulfolobales archaeon]|nr:THUMP domain-containing protein [Sulfolobales archaeon]